MNEKLRKIINHYGIRKQLKYFQSEVFELNESILTKDNTGIFESVIDGISATFSSMLGIEHKDYKKEHIKEEIADVMVMLKQFQLYYGIPTDEIKEIMKNKVARQLNRIEEETKNDKRCN